MRLFRPLTLLLAAGLGLPACADDTKTTTDTASTATDVADSTSGTDTSGSDTGASDSASSDVGKTDGTTAPSDATATDVAQDTGSGQDGSGDTTLDATTWPTMPMPQVLAAIGSDFKTASVSLVDFQNGKALAPAFLTSGTKIGAGGTGLSGDVVLGQTAAVDGSIAVVDRGNAVITLVDPASKTVVGQVAVGTGFIANPQDYAPVSATRAYVSRLGKNPKPTAALDDFDEGDDLLIVDPQAKKITGRVDLTPLASLAGTNAAPQLMAFDGKRVWVSLGSLSSDFSKVGTGRVVAVDAITGTVSATVDLPDVQNCMTIRYIPATKTIAVVCSGPFGSADLSKSGILTIDATVEKPTAKLAISAKTPGVAFGKDAAFAGNLGIAVTPGNFDKKTKDLLWLVDLASGKATQIGEGGGAFSVSGSFGWGSKVWIGEAYHSGGDVRVFDLAGGKATELPSIASNSGGFGAVDLGGF